MSTMEDVDVEIKVTTKITDDGDHDKFQHYFSKKQIEDNIFNGTPMVAVCGKVVLHQVDPKGRTICQTCADIYEQMQGD